MRAEDYTEIPCKTTYADSMGYSIRKMRSAGKERDVFMVVSGVNGAGGTGMQAGAIGSGHAEDAVSKRLMQQIENAQKRLQEISGSSEMSTEEKMKMRQEIQKEISDLNNQLRQHQMEVRKKEAEEAKKKQAENASSMERSGSSERRNAKDGAVNVQLSAEGMQAMISADGAMRQAKVQGSVANRMEGKAGVLETEIKLDSARNGDTSAKEAQLADVRQKAQEAAASQMSTLAEAGEALKEANVAATGGDGTKKDAADETEEKKDREGQESGDFMPAAGESGSEEQGETSGVRYTPVDVRL